ncbi:hypothetical protein WH47_12049, partial [Habropoda laboriosa]
EPSEGGRGGKVTENIRRRDIEVQQQRRGAKIEQSKYNNRYMYIRTIGLSEYLSKEGRDQKLMAQARCRNLENWNKYWEEEEGRRCDMCGDRFGNRTFNKGLQGNRDRIERL